MLTKRPGSPFWQIEFTLCGLAVRRSSGTLERKKAERLEKAWRDEIWAQQKLGEGPAKTFSEVSAAYLAQKGSKRSITRDREVLSMAGLVWRDRPVVGISEADIAGYARTLADGTSEANANRHLAYLRILFNFCVKRKWLDKAPALDFFNPEPYQPIVISREQFELFRAKLPEYLKPVATFGAATGLRWSNVALLHWEPAAPGEEFRPYVDETGKFVHIPASSAKAKKPITVPLASEAKAVLEALGSSRSGYVFRDTKGAAPLNPVRKAWKTAARAAAVPGLRFHDLRHAWCSWHIRAGTPERVVQELGGWSTRSMVQKYSHLDVQHLVPYVK